MPESHEVRDIIKALGEEGLLPRWQQPAQSGRKAWGQKAWVPAHGGGALLSSSGTRPEMPSAVRQGGTWDLPLFPNRNINEKVEIFTAQDADSGSNPSDYSGTPPISGNLRVAQILRTWGELYLGTNPIVAPKVGDRYDYADMDRFPTNGFDPAMNPYLPDVLQSAEDVNAEEGKELFQLGMSVRKGVNYVDFQGDTTKGTGATRVGWLAEYAGLDTMIKTGYQDEVASVAAAALDSEVESISATLAGSHVATISNIVRTLRMRAELAGKPNVVFGIAINPRLKFPLIDIWACNYQTARCDPSTATGARYSLERVTQLRDEMLNGSYLLVDGERIPLLTNFGIAATNTTNNDYQTDLFVVPLLDPSGGQGRVANGVEWLTYREYFPMDNPRANSFLNRINFGEFRITNNGLYMIGKNVSGMTLQYYAAMRQRVMLDYPWLAGRADDITITHNYDFGSPYTTDADYVGGGDDAR